MHGDLAGVVEAEVELKAALTVRRREGEFAEIVQAGGIAPDRCQPHFFEGAIPDLSDVLVQYQDERRPGAALDERKFAEVSEDGDRLAVVALGYHELGQILSGTGIKSDPIGVVVKKLEIEVGNGHILHSFADDAVFIDLVIDAVPHTVSDVAEDVGAVFIDRRLLFRDDGDKLRVDGYIVMGHFEDIAVEPDLMPLRVGHRQRQKGISLLSIIQQLRALMAAFL